ncbi:MAG: ABC transporter ATP-binding protein/permease [Bifidobacteriaceae bacterium]|jgi:ATP-binding cassette subfamily B protein|nr:ABC transporter ATP-binding protein/permease [Bifidobacteriaceae bacterium]
MPSKPRADFFAPVKGALAAIISLSVLGSASSVVPYVAIVELARTLLPSLGGQAVDRDHAWLVVWVAVGALIVSFACTFGSGFVSHLADAELQLSLRRRIIAHLQRLPLGWFDARHSGAVRKLVESDVSALHQLIAHSINDLISATVVPILILAYLFWTQWILGLATLIPLVVVLFLFAAMMGGGTEKFKLYDQASERLGGATVEYVHGIAVVKRFGQVGRSHQRFRAEARRYVDFNADWTKDTLGKMATVEALCSPAVVIVYLLAVGVALVHQGWADPIEILPAVLLGSGVTGPIMSLGASASFLRNAANAQKTLAEFLAIPEIGYADAPQAPEGHAVALDNVGFSYDGEHAVLHEICETCSPGTVTALVGASGSGKSTLARLVPRFYDVAAGAVSIGGADVRQVAADQIYRQVGFVFQDVQLLRASLRDNIRLARPKASDADVAAAARAAQIHDRITRFERGYDAVVGVDANLSGGEAQRVTIARALLADTPILVLDEATAFADPDSEAAIQDALSVLAAGRTVLVIAHRLHTIVGVDQILVLDEGRVVERGTHADLVRSGGRYARMWADYQARHARSTPEGAVK